MNTIAKLDNVKSSEMTSSDIKVSKSDKRIFICG